MLYSIKARDDLEKLNKLTSLETQAKALNLQDNLEKQNFYEVMKKILSPSLKLLKMTPKM